MVPLAIELTKLPMGGALLKCIRADCSIAWQRNEGRRGVFFAFHDLRHYAVESMLGYTEGFYGLIASGWDIHDTTGKGARGALPDGALAVEHLVGMLDADSTNEGRASAAELNQYAASFAAQNNRPVPQRLSDQSLQDIRAMVSALHSRWASLPEGETMKLSFPQRPTNRLSRPRAASRQG
jgi:hypothetical protein